MITDHRGLVSLRTAKQENRRLYNWALKLTEFEFDIVYRSGKENGVADELSMCHEVTRVGTFLRRRGRCGPAHMKKCPHEE